jgi:hypothetical protein
MTHSKSTPPTGATSHPRGDRTVAVVFSKDRPLQLDATLRSLEFHASDAGRLSVKVIWTASGRRQHELYCRLAAEHPNVELIYERDFKSQLVTAARGYDYILFLVDDAIFVRPFSVASATAVLAEDPLVIGYSFRLGRNIDYCYSLRRPQAMPPSQTRPDGAVTFQWVGADADFGYPLEVSSSLYRADDVRPLLERLPYRNPNTLEAGISGVARTFAATRPTLACPDVSVAFCAPVNVVQQVFPNRAGEETPQAADALAEAFRMGMRLDVESLAGQATNAPHREIQLPLTRLGPQIPLVSVVIPCYKQAEYLPSAVESVVRQTLSDWEIVVVDDGSPDDTAQVFDRLKAAHPERAMVLVRQPNSGLAAARNAGISRGRGLYVLPLDADDEFAESMLEETSALLESDRSVAFVYTDAVHFREGSSEVVPAEDLDPGRECDVNQPNYASLIPRSVWETAGGYNSNMKWGYEDWDFWLSCIEHGLMGRRLPRPLLRYRVRPGSMFSSALEHDPELRRQLRRNHPRLYTPGRRAVRLVRRSAGRLASRLGRGT